MKRAFFAVLIGGFTVICSAEGFEGRITATMTRGAEKHSLLYTAGTNFLRIDCLETDRPYPSDIVDTGSGEMTLVFHHNRSFVRFSLSSAPSAQNAGMPPGFPPMQNAAPPPGFPPMAPMAPMGQAKAWTPTPASPGAMPATIGPTNLPGVQPPPMPQMPATPRMPNMPNAPGMPPGVGPQSGPGMPPPGMGRPMMPMMPPMPQQAVELKDTGETTNLMGFRCAHYQIKLREETMDVWATGQLPAFQMYLQNQPHRFGPRRIEEQWGGLLRDKKLFPLLASLKLQNGFEIVHFEVTEIQPQKVADKDGSLSQPPPGYNEMQPLPF